VFESLQNGLTRAFKNIAGRGKLTEANMRESLRMIEEALLEADVSYDVAKAFLKDIREQALGEKVLTSLKPGEQLAAITYKRLVEFMGPVDPSIPVRKKPTVLMMCGLQGSGKTTTCGKLARLIQDRTKASGTPAKILLVAADLQRPGAVDQLTIVGQQSGVPVYKEEGNSDPVQVCIGGVKHAKASGADIVILDTAGRLHIDDELMEQLRQIDRKVEPDQIYMVVDGATGQDAVSSARAFNNALSLDGVIVTKLDGDTRGGATLSVKHVTGVPIKFIGTGERQIDLQEFDPERMASRIFGGGDLGSIIDTASRVIEKDEQEEMQRRMAKGQFTLNDFRSAMKMIKRLGSMSGLLQMFPMGGEMKEALKSIDSEREMRKMQGMIDSMTVKERENPDLIEHNRRRRIAAGSGVEPHEVNHLIKQFHQMKPVMTMMMSPGLSMRDRMGAMQQMMSNPGGPGKVKGSTKQEQKVDRTSRAKALKDLKKQLKNRKK
jgi:signal recognition particle subunit SRP54